MKSLLFLLTLTVASSAMAQTTGDYTITNGNLKLDAGKSVLWGTSGSSGITLNSSTNNLELVQGTAKLLFTTSGNVGLGATVPTAKLDLMSAVAADLMLRVYNTAGDSKVRVVAVDGSEVRYQATHGGSYTSEIAAKNNMSDMALNTLQFRVLGPGTNSEATLATSTRMTIRGDGKVGVGTTTPSQMFEVAGPGGSPGTSGTTQNGIMRVFNAVPNTSIDFGLLAAAPWSGWIQVTQPGGLYSYFPLALNPNGGNVGIGTLTPTDRLHVVGTGTGSTSATLRLQNSTTGSPHVSAVSLERGDTNGYAQVNFVSGFSQYNTQWALGLRANDNNLRVYDAQAGIDRITISPSGLNVSGDITATGVIYAKFQDMAEWVPSDERIPAGMVVIVAPANHVVPSSEEYDTRVAGVVSAQPGLVLGEAGDSKVLVATTGRVKVRVDASRGAIHEGDLLVSSPVKGTAMRSEPLVLNGRKFHQPGTVIGKALQPLERGTGEILVLLSMQ